MSDVSGYPRINTHTVTYYHAQVTWYAPGPDGSSYTGTIGCEHNHTTIGQAERCSEALRRKIERNPERFNDIKAVLV